MHARTHTHRIKQNYYKNISFTQLHLNARMHILILATFKNKYGSISFTHTIIFARTHAQIDTHITFNKNIHHKYF